MATILCVDDEPSVGVVLEHTLTRIGHRPLLVSSVEDALTTVARSAVDLVIADYVMPKRNGLDLLKLLEKDGHKVPVIIMTGYSSIENAVVSMRSGAIAYLTKPIRAETLEIAVAQALEQMRLRKENETLRSEIQMLRSTSVPAGDGPDRNGGAHPGYGAAPWRAGDREGALRPRHPRPEPAGRRTVCDDQLRGAARRARGKRRVWA
jgi:CheY-like chemotaxis protein